MVYFGSFVGRGVRVGLGVLVGGGVGVIVGVGVFEGVGVMVGGSVFVGVGVMVGELVRLGACVTVEVNDGSCGQPFAGEFVGVLTNPGTTKVSKKYSVELPSSISSWYTLIVA
jgi:hypothetical protein